MNPYTDENTTRTFSKDVDKMSLIWHTDQEDRTVTVLESGPQWYFQVDRSIPVGMNEGGEFVIDAKTWHRVLKGAGKLVLEITEHGK